MAKMKKTGFKGLKRQDFGILRARKTFKRLHLWQKILFITIFTILISILIYFGPKILGFAILQQPSSQVTLKVGTYDKTTSWNSTGLVSWWKFDEGSIILKDSDNKKIMFK